MSFGNVHVKLVCISSAQKDLNLVYFKAEYALLMEKKLLVIDY